MYSYCFNGLHVVYFDKFSICNHTENILLLGAEVFQKCQLSPIDW